jgi:hypothetical protein
MLQRIIRVVMLVSFLVPTWTGAQACTNADAVARDGHWSTESEQQAFDTEVPLLRRQYPSLAATADRATALVQQAVPTLRGVDVRVHRTVSGRTLTGPKHVQYEVDGLVYSWYCVPEKDYAPEIAGKVRLGDEASGQFTIFFNSLGRLANERQAVVGLITPGGQRILYPVTQRDSLRGEPLYEPETSPRGASRTIVLTRDAVSLWRPVTRDELLGARIAQQQARIDSVHAGVARVRPLLDTLRARVGPTAPALPDSARMLHGLPKTLLLLTSELQALVTARSALTPNDRDQPAIVTNPYAPPAALFVSAANGGRGLVTVTRGLLKRGQPRTELGMITIEWYWTTDDRAQVAFFRQFTERLDIGALRQLLTRP